MAGFLYFLPGLQTLGGKDIAAAGLAHALDKNYTVVPVTNGPGGHSGIVVSNEANIESPGYHEKFQTWRKATGKEWWLGTVNGAEPTPDDLERPSIMESRDVELIDGHRWKLPVARRFEEPPQWEQPIPWCVQLPQTLGRDDQGHWVPKDVVAKYRALWQLALDWAAMRQGEPDEQQLQRFSDMDGQVNGAVECLAVNYRIGDAEADCLGLLTMELCRSILDTLIDFERFQSLVKKKLAVLNSGNGSPGHADS